MSRERLQVVFFVAALVLTPVSFFLTLSNAGAEPFYQYQRMDALCHIGISTAAIFIWCVWSLGVVGLTVARIFRVWWLGGLLLAALCVLYLSIFVTGYLDDLENFMLAPEQQHNIELPEHKS